MSGVCDECGVGWVDGCGGGGGGGDCVVVGGGFSWYWWWYREEGKREKVRGVEKLKC